MKRTRNLYNRIDENIVEALDEFKRETDPRDANGRKKSRNDLVEEALAEYLASHRCGQAVETATALRVVK